MACRGVMIAALLTVVLYAAVALACIAALAVETLVLR
jgi:hypothetical protein